MKVVVALGNLGAGQLLVADCTDIVQFGKLLWRRIFQQVQLGDRLSSLVKHFPAFFRLRPDVEVCVNRDHHRANCSATLVDQYPGSVAKDEHRKNELDRTLHRLDVKNVVV